MALTEKPRASKGLCLGLFNKREQVRHMHIPTSPRFTLDAWPVPGEGLRVSAVETQKVCLRDSKESWLLTLNIMETSRKPHLPGDNCA